MIRYLIIGILLVTISYNSYSQDLSLNQLKDLQTNSLTYCKIFLKQSGWTLKSTQSYNKDGYTNLTTWYKGGNGSNVNELMMKYSDSNGFGNLKYMFSSGEKYMKIKEEIIMEPFYKFLLSDEDPVGQLNLYYLLAGPKELTFSVIEPVIGRDFNLYLISIKNIKVEKNY